MWQRWCINVNFGLASASARSYCSFNCHLRSSDISLGVMLRRWVSQAAGVFVVEKRNIWVGKVLQKSGGSTETPRQWEGRFYCLFNALLKNEWPEVMLPLSPVKLYFVLFQIFLEVDSFQPSPQLPLYFKAIKQWYAWAELVTDALTACD